MSLKYSNEIFVAIAGPDQIHCMLRKTETGWHPISSQDFAAKVSGVTQALQSWGISPGDRVAILSENRHEWVVADFACMLIGAVVVPIYTTLTPDQVCELLRDSAARAIFVSSQKHVERIPDMLQKTAIERIAVMDEVPHPRATQMKEMMQLPGDSQIDAGRAIKSDDLATIIYTSGTTGTPKGVMLTHGNMASNINYSSREFGFGGGMCCVSFLPLSHVTARSVDLGLLYSGVTLAHLPQIDQLPQALREV